MAYVMQVLVAFNQFLNTLVGGWSDETFSARCWRMGANSENWDRVRRVIDALFFWQDGHCRLSYESEVKRRQLPPSYR